MNYRSLVYLFPLFFILSGCNANAPQTAMTEENLVSVPQIQNRNNRNPLPRFTKPCLSASDYPCHQ